MRWSYKTVHYESKKEGLLGSAFLDEPEIEFSLNEYGRAGWELVSILETMDGIIAVFKQPLSGDASSLLNISPVETDHNEMLQEEDAEVTEREEMGSLEIFSRDEVDGEKEEDAPVLDEFEVFKADPAEERPVEEDPAKEKSEESRGDVGSIRIE
jgi:hypothetical protein